MPNKKDIEDKISSVIDSLKDLDTLEIEQQIDSDNQLSDYSNLLTKISTNPEMAIGAEIDHWTIKGLIGKGGMSIVYLVERNDEQLNQQAALKVIPNGLASKTMIDRFMRERQILSDLNHQNIAKLYDAGVTSEGVPWFVMEYIKGDDIINYSLKNELNIEQKVLLVNQICEALSYAHSQGIVHRDIKPTNIIVTKEKTIKLLDFGIASSEEEQSLTMTGAVIGTPGYMSPEQAKGLSNEIDRRSDIFSLGVLLYKLIKHDMPFNAESISEISYKIIHDEPTLLGNQIPVELQAITFKCLEKEVENRYSSIKSLQEDLNAYMRGDVVSARKVTMLGRLIKKIKKHPFTSAFILAAILSTILGISYGIYQSFESVKKLQLSEKYLAKTQDLKAKIRRTHMMPLHSVQDEYLLIDKEIEQLKVEIEDNNIDDSGLSYFALGEANFNMKKYDKAYDYYSKAKTKGWHSNELYSGLGLTLLNKWKNDELEAKSISNKEAKSKFIESSRKSNLLPAIEYLKRAQLGATDVNYLAAQMAYGEKKYDQALVFAKKEIQANPWHYEALRLASEIYINKFRAIGQSDGYDLAVQYLDLSNKKLDEAINIGRSDPHNYMSRCSNARVDVQVKKILGRDGELNLAFADGVKSCYNALKLKPNDYSLWANLSLMYRSKAVWHESKNEPAIEFYKQALEAAENGLKTHPNEVTLLSYKIRPLVALAEMAFKQGENPDAYFNKAMQTAEFAINANPEYRSAWKENGWFYITYANYLFKGIEDLKAAEKYYFLAREAYKTMNKIDPSIIGVVNINVVEYYLYQLKLAQKLPNEAISFLENSIINRLEILPNRKLYLGHYMFLLKNHIDLVNTKERHDISIDDDINQAVIIFNKVCQFTDLTKKHFKLINKRLDTYLENNWIKRNQVNHCDHHEIK